MDIVSTETAPAKPTIRPNTENMVKTASGSFHKNDFIGNTLAGLTLDQVKAVADELGFDHSKYSALNNGQQRMSIGNALRKIVKDYDHAVLAEKAASVFRGVNDAAALEKAAEKQAAKDAREVAKAERVAAALAQRESRKAAAALEVDETDSEVE